MPPGLYIGALVGRRPLNVLRGTGPDDPFVTHSRTGRRLSARATGTYRIDCRHRAARPRTVDASPGERTDGHDRDPGESRKGWNQTSAPTEYFAWERPGPKLFLQRLYERWAVRANVTLGEHVHVGFGSVVWAPHALQVGSDVYIGKYCTIQCDGEIGNGSLIGNAVGLIGKLDHDYRAVGLPASFSPWIGSSSRHPAADDLRLVVGVDVWIGYGSIVLSGVTVGRGAIVSAGAVVTHDVEPYSIVAGNPARAVGVRFGPDEAVEHERILLETRGW